MMIIIIITVSLLLNFLTSSVLFNSVWLSVSLSMKTNVAWNALQKILHTPAIKK